MYEVMVDIKNSPTKVKGLGYLIDADSREQARKKAMEYAKKKKDKKYSRYKKAIFSVPEENIKERPDW